MHPAKVKISLDDVDAYLDWMEGKVRQLASYRPTSGLEHAAMLMTTHLSLLARIDKVLNTSRSFPEAFEKRQRYTKSCERLRAITESITDHQVNLTLTLARFVQR